ncbi:hypothetical protein [Nocardia sp. NBC_01009]|uniref:hypothetical protein n=1 Tax=Nocardia sp. NBC_01009 TaxID=2975996 RepID=UPI00386F16FF|nr:hypothetical protein OHA42_05865 [Nocardia sp. NBC_01009]
MNYPYGHAGNPQHIYPQVPVYPQRPGYPPPPGYQPRPGGGTAITAGILALIGGVQHTISTVFALLDWRDRHGPLTARDGSIASTRVRLDTVYAVWFGGVGLIAFLLVLGAVLLLCRKQTGRVMVILGAVLALFVAALPIFGVGALGGIDALADSDLAMVVAIGAGPPLLTLILAAWSSTGRWIAAGRLPRYP